MVVQRSVPWKSSLMRSSLPVGIVRLSVPIVITRWVQSRSGAFHGFATAVFVAIGVQERPPEVQSYRYV